MSEPVTNADIIRDLLGFLEDREFIYERPRGEVDWFYICTECERSEEHEPGCKLKAAMDQARAFLRAEDELEMEQERGQALPHHAG